MIGSAGLPGEDQPRLLILGIRGVPAAHGGFETFAEQLALWLAGRGWHVTVYCQGSATGVRYEDVWQGVHRVHIPVSREGAPGTIEFDWKSTADALRRPGVILTLGYNTGFLSSWVSLRGRRNAINMDGLEWKRAKYGLGARAFLWLNEQLAARAGSMLIADHPSIADHLATRVRRENIVMIPYGADAVETGDAALLDALGLRGERFFTVIARPEPENSILEIVRAYSSAPRGAKLVMLGKYSRDHPFQRAVLDAAGAEVMFPGAIYDKAVLAALRGHSLAYVHGHTAGGTNPSLVEALGAGSAVIAHDNRYNRWVAGKAALYFGSEAELSAALDAMLTGSADVAAMRAAARLRWQEAFTWPMILEQYERLLLGLGKSRRS